MFPNPISRRFHRLAHAVPGAAVAHEAGLLAVLVALGRGVEAQEGGGEAGAAHGGMVPSLHSV